MPNFQLFFSNQIAKIWNEFILKNFPRNVHVSSLRFLFDESTTPPRALESRNP